MSIEHVASDELERETVYNSAVGTDEVTQETENHVDIGVQCSWVTKNNPFSIEKYIDNPQAVQYFTGFQDYYHFSLFYNILSPTTADLPYQCRLSTLENQLFLTLIKLRLFLDHQLLAYFFIVSISTVSKLFSFWVNFIYLKPKYYVYRKTSISPPWRSIFNPSVKVAFY